MRLRDRKGQLVPNRAKAKGAGYCWNMKREQSKAAEGVQTAGNRQTSNCKVAPSLTRCPTELPREQVKTRITTTTLFILYLTNNHTEYLSYAPRGAATKPSDWRAKRSTQRLHHCLQSKSFTAEALVLALMQILQTLVFLCGHWTHVILWCRVNLIPHCAHCYTA